jgi:hypothetical protein
MGTGTSEGKYAVTSRQYLRRQATTLLKFAKTISDPKVAAGLVEKAADLKSKGDERPDPSPRAPDIECST